MSNQAVSCQTRVDSGTDATCGTKGSTKEMFYFLLPTGTVIVTCPTCKNQLSSAYDITKQPYKFASVATVRSLAGFAIELVPELGLHVGHCSFMACDCELGRGEVMALQHGTEYRRICQNDAAALSIISTRAANQLKADATSAKKMDKSERKDVEREALLVPVTMWVAQRAVNKLQEEARKRIDAALQFAQAQLAPPPKAAAPKPQPKAEAIKPAPTAKPATVAQPKAQPERQHSKGGRKATAKRHMAPGIKARRLDRVKHIVTSRVSWFSALVPANKPTEPAATAPVVKLDTVLRATSGEFHNNPLANLGTLVNRTGASA